LDELGTARDTFYFNVHGEVNTRKTVELAYERAALLGIDKAVVASETGLSAIEVLKVFKDMEVIVVSSAAGTEVEGTAIGDLRIGIPDEAIHRQLLKGGAKVIRGTDPFWNLSAHTQLVDTGKLGMMFLKTLSSGLHVCMTAVLEATDAGHLKPGEEVVALAGSWVGLDTAIVAKAVNSVHFFDGFEVLELICKPRRARHTWPVDQKDWVGNLEKYRRFTI
jgi:hypothetical protein